MTAISIIGAGNMAAAIGGRAARAGYDVEIISRDPARSAGLAARIGHGATAGTFGRRPRGEVVIVAVLHAAAVDAVAQFGDALSGKTVVDITNPFNSDGSGLVTGPGDSMAHRIDAAIPEDAFVVKALNTIYGGAIADDKAVDAFLAGDDGQAKRRVADLLTALGLRPLDAGGLEMAHALEWAGLLLVGLSRSGAGFDIALATQPL